MTACGRSTSTPCSLPLLMNTITSFEDNTKSVTYVAGQFCYLCPRLLIADDAASDLWTSGGREPTPASAPRARTQTVTLSGLPCQSASSMKSVLTSSCF